MANHLFMKQPLYEKVGHFIRKEILLGRWKHGDHLNETKIAEELNMSRGPVRDALKLLDSEGMVETPSNGRTVVIGFNQKSFNDWSNVRLHLEIVAIKEAINKIPKDQKFEDIEMILEEMKKINNLEQHIRLDLLFHKSIVESSGNKTLAKLWNILSGTLSTLLELIASNYDNQEQIKMHSNILDAMKVGDVERACNELEVHIKLGNKVLGLATQKVVN